MFCKLKRFTVASVYLDISVQRQSSTSGMMNLLSVIGNLLLVLLPLFSSAIDGFPCYVSKES